METSGFTVVTSGQKRESLAGPATLALYGGPPSGAGGETNQNVDFRGRFPHVKELAAQRGVLEALNTEVSTSRWCVEVCLDRASLSPHMVASSPFAARFAAGWTGRHPRLRLTQLAQAFSTLAFIDTVSCSNGLSTPADMRITPLFAAAARPD